MRKDLRREPPVLTRSDLAPRAIARWRAILSALGVRSEFLTNRHGPCPTWGGKDRFRWDNKHGNGTFYCSHCGAGDGFGLLLKLKGWDFRTTAEQIEAIIGSAKVEASRPIRSDAEYRAAMQARWRACRAIETGDAVARYLEARLGLTEFPAVLRSASDRPVMVAL